MFEVGMQEIVLVFVIGLIILGPERLPKVAAQAGRWIGRARRMANQLRYQLEREIALEEVNRVQRPAPTPAGTDSDAKPDAASAAETSAGEASPAEASPVAASPPVAPADASAEPAQSASESAPLSAGAAAQPLGRAVEGTPAPAEPPPAEPAPAEQWAARPSPEDGPRPASGFVEERRAAEQERGTPEKIGSP